MSAVIDERWAEIQFYTICTDILQIRNNLIDVMDIIDCLAIFGNYASEQIKPLAQLALTAPNFRPSREEFCILCYIQGVPIKEIKARTGMHNKTLYNLINKEKKNPRAFYTRTSEEQRTLIKQFINTFEQLKKAGV